jgi:hypothetical protein
MELRSELGNPAIPNDAFLLEVPVDCKFCGQDSPYTGLYPGGFPKSAILAIKTNEIDMRRQNSPKVHLLLIESEV